MYVCMYVCMYIWMCVCKYVATYMKLSRCTVTHRSFDGKIKHMFLPDRFFTFVNQNINQD